MRSLFLKSINQLTAFFRDRRGKIVIFQYPNWPIMLVIAVYLLRPVASPLLAMICSVAITILMLYWSYLEIRFGESPFRRVLGLLVGLYFLFGILQIILDVSV